MVQLPLGTASRATVVAPLMMARRLVPEMICGGSVAFGARLPARAGAAATPDAVAAATLAATMTVRAFDHFACHYFRRECGCSLGYLTREGEVLAEPCTSAHSMR